MATEAKHKVAQGAIDPYQVKGTNQETVIIAIGDEEKRVSRDMVEFAPSPMDHVPITSRRHAPQLLSGTNSDWKGNVSGDENGPRACASTPVDSNQLISNSQLAEVWHNTQESGSLEP